jgi:hypothetical protein
LTKFCSLYIALTHCPVTNKNGEIIASAVTNLDLHDIARTGRTYGVAAFYVITPLTDQKDLVGKIVSHWTSGAGGVYNPFRRQALELIRISDCIENAMSDIEKREGKRPCLVATTAEKGRETLDFQGLRKKLTDGAPCLLLFGTAWGMADEVFQEADHVLTPIDGAGDYNHLSVRCASAIILDRLAGQNKDG